MTKLLLWSARWSSHWESTWVAQEKCFTNKSVLKGYLSEDLITRLCFLQKELIIKQRNGVSHSRTEWEVLRLLAVMEVANNGDNFSQHLMGGSVSFLLAAKFSLDWRIGSFHFREESVCRKSNCQSICR